MAEHAAVNRTVAGSNPARGAIHFFFEMRIQKVSHTIRSKEDRKITQAVQDTILYSQTAGHLNGPNSKPSEAIKAMPEERRKFLEQVKQKHVQDTVFARKPTTDPS